MHLDAPRGEFGPAAFLRLTNLGENVRVLAVDDPRDQRLGVMYAQQMVTAYGAVAREHHALQVGQP